MEGKKNVTNFMKVNDVDLQSITSFVHHDVGMEWNLLDLLGLASTIVVWLTVFQSEVGFA
jgi:hypothetical protein